MRLICGILSFDDDIPGNELLPRMCQAMQSPTRPATVTEWSNDRAALAVLDFARHTERTPPAIPSSPSHAFAADLRLDNRAELEAALNLRNLSDPALALAAFRRWDEDAPAHLLGDFALAWFNREQHTLTLARDIFGVRPLAYFHQPGRYVVFASLPRGLFPSGLVPREIDPLAVAHQIQFRFLAEDTLFRNVRMLPPAHTITFARHGEDARRYWQPQLQPQRHATPLEAAAELRTLLDTAVRCRLPPCGPAAAHLSGGIDSSTISAFAARALQAQHPPRSLHGFSFWPDEPPGLNLEYERPYVEAVLAQHPTIVCHRIPSGPSGTSPGTSTGVSPREGAHPDRILSLADQDPENAVCLQAAALGADTILSGWGGDEGATFNGRGVMAQSLLTLHWHYLAHEVSALRATRGWSVPHTLAGEILPFFLPDAARDIKSRLLHRQPKAEEQWRHLLQPAVLAALSAEKEQHALSIGPNARRNQRALLRSGHLAWRATNWAVLGARYGVGFTFPMLDRRVVELILSVPAQWHLRDGFKRRLIRDATEGILPDAIRWRHTKIVPFPQSLTDAPQQCDAILQRLHELAALPSVQAIFQPAPLLALGNALPRHNGAGTPHPAASPHALVTLCNVIACCTFLELNA